MTGDRGEVLLVGSIARPEDEWSVEDVLRHSAHALSGHVSMLPDGEIGDRSQWITYIARHAYHGNPDLVTLSRHTYEDWKPRHYDDQWRFGVREGADVVHLPKVGYADEAKRSYEIFRRLRDDGIIGEGVRFLVAYPLTESAVRAFFGTGREFEIVWRAYNDAVRREIAELAVAIPHEDLAIQWDMARETAAVEGIEFNFSNSELQSLPADPLDRFCEALSDLSRHIPHDVWLGLHVCYGSLQHREGESPDSAHYVPMRDLGVAVEMLNRGVVACGRRLDYVHMPVQLSELTDAFYAPLERLDVGDARVYIGLTDPSDGLQGALKRVDLARRHCPSFGVSTPCGWGRRPLSQKPDDLLALNREVAAALSSTAGSGTNTGPGA